ncbi:MAG: DNA alkylation repair protein [DPANN group archaeon]|nr:DNA alkylation repair protein [DPANN group archaeon]
MLNQLKKELQKLSNPKKAAIMQRFFKTGPGEYGEGDVFIGPTVPEQRSIAKKYIDLDFKDIQILLNNKIHEYRLTGIFILVYKFQRASDKEKKKIYNFYIKNFDRINNWDLIDCTCDKILGPYMLEHSKEKKKLYKWVKSRRLWTRRISIITTFEFIKNNEFEDTLKVSGILLHDGHDLIHKAVGWMLREIGKRDQAVEERFLRKHYKQMPRTMLRYAIERFDEKKRQFYMKK